MVQVDAIAVYRGTVPGSGRHAKENIGAFGWNQKCDAVIEHITDLASEFKLFLTQSVVYRLAKVDDPFGKQMQMEE